jgi:ribonuclease HII
LDALDPRPDTVQRKGVATPADGVENVENTAEPPPSRARAPSGFLARLRPLDATEPVLHLGIDENGLGPVLGPMIVTAVAFRIAGPRPSSLGSLVGDSKALVSHADVSLGEAWTRALLAAVGPAPQTTDEIVARVSIDDAATLRAPCPSPPVAGDAGGATAPLEHHPASMCWPPSSEPFVADDALVEKCARVIRGWTAREREGGRFVRRTPIQFLGLRASIYCASRLNAAMSSGRHKFVVDLHEMERLALALHETFGSEGAGGERTLPLDAICGKVGGMGYYCDYFGPLSARLRAIEAESELASAYRFPGLGRVTFLQDADAADPLVGLASIVGKYLRELLMGRIVRWLRAAATPETCAAPDELPPASGYRDPNTKRLVAATELVRAHRGVPDRCFLREK